MPRRPLQRQHGRQQRRAAEEARALVRGVDRDAAAQRAARQEQRLARKAGRLARRQGPADVGCNIFIVSVAGIPNSIAPYFAIQTGLYCRPCMSSA